MDTAAWTLGSLVGFVVILAAGKTALSKLGIEFKTKTAKKVDEHQERIVKVEKDVSELRIENRQQTEKLGAIDGKMDVMLQLMRNGGQR